MALNCVDTAFFGQVCDSCNGGAIYQILAGCLDILTILIGACAVIGIIIAGIMYINSAGDVARQTKAKRRIYEVIIGLCCYGVLFAFANFLIPGGVIRSSSDNTALSCPAEKPKATEQISLSLRTEPETQDTPQNEEQPGETISNGKYPMATVAGQPSAGYISCPRNANYSYTANPAGPSGTLDKWFQTVAASCPFTKVVYTNDESCAPGGNMHSDGKWCLINSKIDVYEYQTYLKNNNIKQDGRTCLADKQECASGENLSDWGACYYFSSTFASNLNNGEVVSNDAYAAQLGISFHNAYWGRTQFGTRITTWNGRNVSVYDDGLTGVALNPNASAPLPRYNSPDGMGEIIKELRAGHAVAIGVHNVKVDSNPNKNCGHYLTAIGYTTDCANGASCSANNLVVLNTNGEISTLGNTNYRIGYRRACTGP